MSVENIRKFLATAYSDEQLAALLAHTESGKLSYYSCCCLVGIPTAPHALRGPSDYGDLEGFHVWDGRRLPFAAEAEHEFAMLSVFDSERREALLPLIREEMNQREFNRLLKQCDEMSATVSEGTELLAEARERLAKTLREFSVTGDFAVSCGTVEGHGGSSSGNGDGRSERVRAKYAPPYASGYQAPPAGIESGLDGETGAGRAETPTAKTPAPVIVREAERKHHCTAHRLEVEAAERWPGGGD